MYDVYRSITVGGSLLFIAVKPGPCLAYESAYHIERGKTYSQPIDHSIDDEFLITNLVFATKNVYLHTQ